MAWGTPPAPGWALSSALGMSQAAGLNFVARLCLSQKVEHVPCGGLWSGTEVDRGLLQNSTRGLEDQGTRRGFGAGGSSRFGCGVTWWPEGPRGYPVRSSQDCCPPRLRGQLLQSPLCTPNSGLRQPSVWDRTLWPLSPVWSPQRWGKS